MTQNLASKARRLLIASGFAVVLGVPTLACMGGDTSSDGSSDGATDGAVEEPDKGGDDSLEAQLVGNWKLQPSEAVLRELKIIRNAIEGKPPPKKLQPLSDSEKKLFKDAKKASGKDQDYFRNLIARLKGARVMFEDNGKGRYDFDGGRTPFTYKVSNESGKKIDVVITYEDGMKEEATLTRKGDEWEVHFTKPSVADYQFKPA